MTIKIFLGNLSSDTTSDKIRPLFEKYGQVVECDVLKNFGFVHMVNKNEANKAIAQLDGYSVDGNNIRVELSTGKKGPGGGGGKFDKKGFGGGRPRPYGGGPPGRGGGGSDPRDFDRYPYPPLPPVPAYDRYDPYYRYYMEREAYYARMDRGYASARERGYPPLPPRERLADRYPPDPRDRLMPPPPRSYLEDRARGLPEPYFRERDPLAARPPPEYYDRKGMGAGRAEPTGAAGAAGGRGGVSGPMGANGVGAGGEFSRYMDRPGAGMGGGGSGAGGPDFFRQAQSSYGRAGLGGMGKSGDSQSSFAQDAIFF
ncbi:hypothetical protein RRG08_026720 [Elysia crispata]|uniref:RRM domain-containing protein n=1 Tax=Elysia crispata TaxID=231223 RepID=A0AAE0XWP3_9GAST|nr:hypothetical protein RRG08_026720 [Elysia crispata]